MCTRHAAGAGASAGKLPNLSRHSFLARCASALALCALPSAARAFAGGDAPDRYLLVLERVDTGEYAAEPFTLDGKKLYWAGYKKLCAILRDEHVPPEVGFVQINVGTIEALWAVQSYLRGAKIVEPLMIHSGYRTAQTNAQTEGAARLSYHMWGKAVDFHVDGVALSDLAGICQACPNSGGVGYYPDGWVHMDTGPKRYWVG